MTTVTSIPPTVLLIDDEPLILEVLGKLMQARGMRFRTANSGEQGVELLRREQFGCLLTDKNLSGINGLDVMRVAREEQPYCACILMTGYASTSSAVEALQLGATDYLEKPFPDLNLVAAKVKNAIRTQQLAFERDSFLERLRVYQAELHLKDATVQRQQTEIQMFEQILAARVEQATQAQALRCKALEEALAMSKDSADALHAHAESILEYVREAQAGRQGGGAARGGAAHRPPAPDAPGPLQAPDAEGGSLQPGEAPKS